MLCGPQFSKDYYTPNGSYNLCHREVAKETETRKEQGQSGLALLLNMGTCRKQQIRTNFDLRNSSDLLRLVTHRRVKFFRRGAPKGRAASLLVRMGLVVAQLEESDSYSMGQQIERAPQARCSLYLVTHRRVELRTP